ncbi:MULTISPECIES: hypothetical protein [Giesbergeria]|uniref:Uncharacterized protein n=1 Tax=Giesbergeria sinuosa TaxID=80883 RepID=A0ABV9Q967_9BURK
MKKATLKVAFFISHSDVVAVSQSRQPPHTGLALLANSPKTSWACMNAAQELTTEAM